MNRIYWGSNYRNFPVLLSCVVVVECMRMTRIIDKCGLQVALISRALGETFPGPYILLVEEGYQD